MVLICERGEVSGVGRMEGDGGSCRLGVRKGGRGNGR
jgi:hypothetical protein